MPNYLAICEQAARVGGESLLQWKGKFHVKEKAPRDLVTEADVASQKAIRDVVLEAFPDHDFVGEESLPDDPARKAHRRSEFRWIVDPLDGTTNYVHQLRSYSVSVALEQAGTIIAGVVYDPDLDECYSAEAGEGAFLNGRRLHGSNCRQPDQALVAASLPARVPRDSPEVLRLVEIIHECQAVRRLGSAALNLCYVAQGALDAYWATSVKLWDVAAGMLIVREAGAVITALDGGEINLQRPRFLAAATPELHRELLAILHRIPQD
ncbi:MAG: inositol monophosphatase [Planctomycetes bacterium]|nr:inositol monophosphatase [Planctomycetota bacterium]